MVAARSLRAAPRRARLAGPGRTRGCLGPAFVVLREVRALPRLAAGAEVMPADAVKVVAASDLDAEALDRILARPRVDFGSIFDTVTPIVDAVRDRGDDAVNEFTNKFDRVDMNGRAPVVAVADLPDPELDDATRTAFDIAYDNIRAFHEGQVAAPLRVETMPGVVCERVTRPIDAVGLYVPGGTAILPSTTLMLAVPAQVAGCATMVVATPPRADGSVCPEVLYVCKKCGVTHLLQAGGAQAVAAMAYGTASCPKVHKIFGPGNQFVTAAKMLLSNSEAMVAIDMPAGPSEVLVIADGGAPPAHVAADLLSQAEHGRDSQVVLLATPDADMDAIVEAVAEQCAALPRREVAEAALQNSCCIRVGSMDEAIEISNRYAPEHLILNIDDARRVAEGVTDAGSIFCGRWTPESVGDYASGTNHVLPTYGYARMYSGVSLSAYLKHITVQELSEDGLKELGPHVAHMAALEGLDAHRRAVTLRLGME